MYRKLTESQKAQIVADATKNANAGIEPVSGCPWPFASIEGRLWVASWIQAGGVYRDMRGDL